MLLLRPAAAKAMVLAAKPTIEDTSSALEPQLLDTLFANLGMLASVYQKPPEAFASRVRPDVLQVDSVEAPRAVRRLNHLVGYCRTARASQQYECWPVH
jgi:hypothetical protein